MISNLTLGSRPQTKSYSLKDSLSEREKLQIRTLVIADNDPHLVARLAEMLDPNQSLLIAEPQERWSFDRPEWRETIEFLLEESAVTEVVLCGHSHPVGNPDLHSSLVPEDSNWTRFSEERRSILGRVLRNKERLEASKSQYQNRVAQFLSTDRVSDTVRMGDLQVHGLFYLKHSGLFMEYEIETGQFVAICPDERRM